MELNKVYCGDNLEVLKSMPSESVDLIYIDPPFFSNRHYEVIWGNGAELRSFGDRWGGGLEHYVGWMKERFKEFHRILKPTGAFYIHVDWHAVHYLKIELDKIFGYDNFRNEIIWHYTGRRMYSKNKFNSKHDNILFYSKTGLHTINEITEAWTRGEYLKMKKQELHNDKDGKEWIWGHQGKGKSHAYKIYIDEVIKRGRVIDSVWNIPIINTSSKERIGYPTQKPEALLERIIKASTNEGDIVLDAFCGCGTTIAVAEKLNRKWIAIDVSPVAVKLALQRIQKVRSSNS